MTLATKLQLSGAIGSALAFGVLFVGAGDSGGGHGSPATWFVGLFVAALAGLILAIGAIRGGVCQGERAALIPGVVLVAVVIAIWLNFFTLAEWLGTFVYR